MYVAAFGSSELEHCLCLVSRQHASLRSINHNVSVYTALSGSVSKHDAIAAVAYSANDGSAQMRTNSNCDFFFIIGLGLAVSIVSNLSLVQEITGNSASPSPSFADKHAFFDRHQ
jgi:hypothetical protein